MDITAFRQNFPAFADTNRYPAAEITYFAGLAGKLLPEERWDDLLGYGTDLFVAHHLSLSDAEAKQTGAGATPGKVTGIQTAKAVDKVSASYDVANISLTDGGYWNTTSYGIRFLQLARMVGAGGVQL